MATSNSSARPIVWIALLALAVTCAVTNPDKSAHIAGIREKLADDARSSGELGAAIGAEVMGGLIETMVGGLLQYNSYVVFSTTAAHKDTVSVGALGQVFVVKLGEKKSRRR